MKRLLVALALPLLLVQGCGSDEEPAATSVSTAPAAVDPAAEELKATCDKLGRAWAVKAGGLRSGLYLMVDRAKDDADAMTDATDQMEIEGCAGEAFETALMGNYEAALAVAKMQICLNDGEDVCDAAGDSWVKKGEPLVAQVKGLTAP